MKPSWKRTVARITVFAIAGAAGCATVPETGWAVPEVKGTEEEVVCSGACDAEWRRAGEWVKKHSGYGFPAEVVVTPDRITASRVPLDNCVSVPQSRRHFLAPCSRPPLASEPLGFGDNDDRYSMIGKTFADGGPHWTFLVLRQAMESGSSRIHLIQSCRSQGARPVCRVPGIREHRQDRFRRFVRTGELVSR